MINLTVRSTLPEKMDDLKSPVAELYQNLRELEVINKLLGGYSVILHSLSKLNFTEEKLTVMDLGCGGGDTLRVIAQWAKKNKKQVTLIGIDYNPVMITYANETSEDFPEIQFRIGNVFDDSLLNDAPDIVICSLFCHHFENKQLIMLLQQMKKLAGRAVIINDLHRHWIAYYSISILTALFSKTYMVKHDARLSVAKAFKRHELIQLLSEAGIENYTLNWRWAWRWELIIRNS